MRENSTPAVRSATLPVSPDEPVPPSDRSFGFVLAAALAIYGALPMWWGNSPISWSIALSLAFAVFALAIPAALAPANRLWFRLGLLLHRVVNPVVMAALFYLVLTPFALVSRLVRPATRKSLRPDPGASSYWIRCDARGTRMTDQF
jgi:hypothetical protein